MVHYDNPIIIVYIDNVSIGNGRHFNGSIALRYTDKELGGNYVLFTTTLPTMYGKGHQGWLVTSHELY